MTHAMAIHESWMTELRMLIYGECQPGGFSNLEVGIAFCKLLDSLGAALTYRIFLKASTLYKIEGSDLHTLHLYGFKRYHLDTGSSS